MLNRKRLAVVLAASALTASMVGSAAAQSATDLQRQINALQAQIEELKKQEARNARNAETAAQTTKSAGPTVSVRGGPTITSEDGNFSFKLGGRVHLDAAYYDDDTADMNSGFLFRRARLAADVTLYKDWFVKMQYNFAESGSSDFSDVYIQYRGIPNVRLTAGQHKVPFGLEELTSSNNITFMERSIANNLFAPARKIGFGATYTDKMFTVAAMVHGRNVGDTTNGDDPLGYGARVTVAPVNEAGMVIHLGAAAGSLRTDDSNVTRLRDRPESRVAGERLIDTGTIANVRRTDRFGLEAAAVYGPFSVQGEYNMAKVKRTAGFENASYDGWYAQASWIVTGESRSYSKGSFGGVTPENDFGAFELAARYSVADLNDVDIIIDPLNPNNQGGELKLLSLGANYYINRNMRVMVNYINVNNDNQGPRTDEPSVFQARLQASF